MKTISNPFVHVEIYVDDMDRAVRFYEQVLDCKLHPMNNPDAEDSSQMVSFPWAENAPNCGGALIKMKGMPAGGSGTVVYFGSEDCAKELGRVEAAGGKVCREKFSIGEYGFCGIATDSEGNTIGFHSMN